MPQNSDYRLEICVDSPDAILAAATVADRIELCQGLDVGGLTPDHGLMKCAAEIGVETHVLIRGRCGDFTMNEHDLGLACYNIRRVGELGLKGVVIGAEYAGKLDLRALETMAKAAEGLDITLHRVIDVIDNPLAALDEAAMLGFDRVLTSGGAVSAPDGIAGLQQFCAAADDRIEIMAGGGINSSNLPDLLEATPITSFHASCSGKTPLHDRYASFGFGSSKRMFDLGCIFPRLLARNCSTHRTANRQLGQRAHRNSGVGF